MKILIAIPCYEAAPVEFCQSLMNLILYEERRCENQIDVLFMGSSLVYEARNKLALAAISKGADAVLWVDSDMLFPEDALEQLIRHGKEFVCGQYFCRKPPFSPCVFSAAEIRVVDNGAAVEPYNELIYDQPDELFEIAACGFAFVFTTTELIAKTYADNGLPFQPIGGFGEDMSFCIRARDSGYKLYCDPNCKIGHLGKMVVNENSYLSYANKDRGEAK
jgi:hypothetical protein